MSNVYYVKCLLCQMFIISKVYDIKCLLYQMFHLVAADKDSPTSDVMNSMFEDRSSIIITDSSIANICQNKQVKEFNI